MTKRPYEAVLVCESVVTNYKLPPFTIGYGILDGFKPALEPENYTATFAGGKVVVKTEKPLQVGKDYHVVVEESE